MSEKTIESRVKNETARSFYMGRYYHPVIPPQGDTDELAALGERLMFLHGTATSPESHMFTAPEGDICAGWVLGVFETTPPINSAKGKI